MRVCEPEHPPAEDYFYVETGGQMTIFRVLFYLFIYFFYEHMKYPQVASKPVPFILLPDRPSSHAACTEIDIKAREIQLT